MSVRLRELSGLAGVLRLEGDAELSVERVCSDSRLVLPGDLFASLSRDADESLRFARDAVGRGARALLVESPCELSVPQVVVDNVRERLGVVSHRVMGEPTRELCVVGVTGTNGKTTVTYLLESILEAAGYRPALLGTVAMRGPAGETAAWLTTPEADTVASFARAQRGAGATHLVMEVSSHGLEQHRVDGVRFACAAFTNLTQDHLDYHGNMEVYGEVKASLFTTHAPALSVIMTAGEFGQALAARAEGRVLRCGLSPQADADIRLVKSRFSRAGIEATVQLPVLGEFSLVSPLYGAHNLENLLVAIGVAYGLGVDTTALFEALKTARGAPGRMERVEDPRDVLVLVDYAHTPDALERAIAASRSLTEGRLFVVAGCGGDRDRKKRGPMGEIVARGADFAFLTSDNPRTESPLAILSEMEVGARGEAAKIDPTGLADASCGYAVVEDRAEAIRLAIAHAKKGDTVLIAGKGHETYQIIGTVRHAFDDREQAALAIASAKED